VLALIAREPRLRFALSRVNSSFEEVPILWCSCFTASENPAVAALCSFTRRAFSLQRLRVGTSFKGMISNRVMISELF
jgi:hypothetical protein